MINNKLEMRFTLENAGLIKNKFGTSAKPKFYLTKQKFFKETSTLLFKKIVENIKSNIRNRLSIIYTLMEGLEKCILK